MIILAVDTSSRRGSVALSVDQAIAGPIRFGSEDSHLVALSTTIDRLLKERGLTIRDVDRIALVAGPGSFTGLRIGMAFVKGIHAALATEVATMTSLELIAYPLLDNRCLVCSMIDARKSEVYAALYRLGREKPDEGVEVVIPPKAVSPKIFLEALRKTTSSPVLFVGSGALRYRKRIDGCEGVRASFARGDANTASATVLASIAEKLTPLANEEILMLEPFYIRSSDAELKRLKAHRTDERN
ncbi:MAG: tRNA (adenosine(37)-N6)-threonylcarbamoyltransferase complex dimerization subunit type 1 TsaB [Candidatus Latescibacteria bacterium]|nr:tRNA (adenosine(37)-N6)-threonylcarbamoyltransferase complex dimerization subunit type 1 TsaB [Candidatus Latescibacterota bacterium]NIM22326.1 tRNA (adenosine(37)-N6)-threonylcarbamoyltransferase complex dimerization subunit type 1 TsaB [Candidatus Latescibacterota bacterium]NIM66155.1 tRNA (adenosine(37)-N6)-threonylcarbamoyltransferase complex dimerization subunit type 1 TsaB [Candidatus Latescibacterota bacterium]NIO02563.1 tRNA (adenosine(37)-N6)-threonylcarbamoyltransferase complex dime